MTRLAFLILSIAFPASLCAQKISGSLNTGIATYSLKSYKNFSDELFSVLLPGPKPSTTDNFPPYVFYEGQINLTKEASLYGLAFGHGSSGSRTYYGDYSGHYNIDHLYSYNFIGLRIGEKLFVMKNFFVALNFRLTYIRNAMEIKESLTVGNQQGQESTHFRSMNIGVQPFFQFQKDFSKFYVKSEIGFEYQIPFKVHLKGEPHAFLVNSNNGNVELSGNGLRWSIGVGFYFADLVSEKEEK